MSKFEELKGKVLSKIEGLEKDSELIRFTTEDNEIYEMFHFEDPNCCESVLVEDVNGNSENLIGSKILVAMESTSSGESEIGSLTWTFYKLSTKKGWLDIRWYGESNGYYAEEVYFEKVDKEEGSMKIVKAKSKKKSCFTCKYVRNGMYPRYDEGREYCALYEEVIPSEFENKPGVCDAYDKLKVGGKS